MPLRQREWILRRCFARHLQRRWVAHENFLWIKNCNEDNSDFLQLRYKQLQIFCCRFSPRWRRLLSMHAWSRISKRSTDSRGAKESFITIFSNFKFTLTFDVKYFEYLVKAHRHIYICFESKHSTRSYTLESIWSIILLKYSKCDCLHK